MMNATDSYLLLRAFVDELARCGVRDACTSPGSRSTPIVLTLTREQRMRCWSHIDERCSGFFALGAAKATGMPTVVTCTSGTAAANLMPAVIEAHSARVPMIVLTADRPPELREVGAGQAIDQIKLYGDAVKWFFEVGLHEATPDRLRWVRALACRVVSTALDAPGGPVHLNFPLREPLVLDAPLAVDAGGAGRSDGRPWVSFSGSSHGVASSERAELRGAVFVAGALSHDPEIGRALAALAARARLPLLADPISGARCGPAAIVHYDLLLREPVRAAALTPAVVCRFGELPTSKPLRAWLAGLEVPQLHFAADRSWLDPDSRLSEQTVAPLSELIGRLAERESVTERGDQLELWREADAATALAIDAALPKDRLSEPLVASILGGELPTEATLFVASSMPVRDLETYMPAREDPPRVLSNRGANGIDGTVSAAFGAAAAGAGPVALLIGDVALAHESADCLPAAATAGDHDRAAEQ